MNILGIFKRDRVEKANPVGQIIQLMTPFAQFSALDFVTMAKEGYLRNAVTFKCIYSIATAASNIPLKIVELQDGQYVDVENAELMKLLYEPNPMQDGCEFFQELYSHYYISGNAYLARDRAEELGIKQKPLELYTFRPDRMRIKPGPGIPQAYLYKVNQGEVEFPVDAISGQSNVLHFKNFHPIDEWQGLSFMSPAAYSIDIHNDISKWNKATLQNAARPSGAFVVKGKGKDGAVVSLTDTQYNRLRADITDQYAGSENAGKPLLLEGGIEWQQISMSPEQMDFISNIETVSRQICMSLNYPPLLLGLPGDNTYANYKEARLAVYEDTILPLVNRMAGRITMWLRPWFGDNFRIVPDTDNLPALEPKRELEYARTKDAIWLTINEKRKKFGLEPLEGGDTLYIGAGEVPIGFMSDEESRNNGENEGADNP